MEDKPDIERVLEYYAGAEGRDFILRQAAGTAKIRCPFHDDNRPSAVVNLETGRFHCFACDAPSGDSYDLIMQREGIGFNDAKQWASEHLGYEGGKVHRAPPARRYRPAFGADEDD